eukprot:GFUD01023210.1.p1 GENE.GFUD01023210.1~~GFUD01023210.1.p1  ORF type:complete len:683 (-),score=158.04 GFUD01023210.1:59-2107(-)
MPIPIPARKILSRPVQPPPPPPSSIQASTSEDNKASKSNLLRQVTSSAQTRPVNSVPTKSAPPLPTKPAHLQRKSVTPPPDSSILSPVLCLSSSSLAEHDLSYPDHPQLSSTLKPQRGGCTQPLSTSQPSIENIEDFRPPKPPVRRESMSQSLEAAIEDKEEQSLLSNPVRPISTSQPPPVNMQGIKPPKPPVRRESMSLSREAAFKYKEDRSSLRNSAASVTSFEESFFTRFQPLSTFPAPFPFTNCEKTYPSLEQGQGTLARKYVKSTAPSSPSPIKWTIQPVRTDSENILLVERSDEVGTLSKSSVNKTSPSKPQAIIRKPTSNPPSPPLATITVPLPPPLPVDKTKIPPEAQVSTNPPPPPPLPPTVPCPLPSSLTSEAEKSDKSTEKSSSHQANELPTKSPTITDSPITVENLVSSGLAVNLAKIFSTGCQPAGTKQTKASSQDTENTPPPVLGKNPGFVVSSEVRKKAPPPLRMKSQTTAVLESLIESSSEMLPKSNSSASLPSSNSSPSKLSRANSFPTPGQAVSNLTNISRPAPPPPPHKTSSLSNINSPGQQEIQPSLHTFSRGQSFRAAPPPPKPVTCSSSNPSLHTSLTSKSAGPIPANLKMSASHVKTGSPNTLSRGKSYRAAPPPPPVNYTPNPHHKEPLDQDTITSQSSSSLLGSPRVAPPPPNLLIC